jgi:hypothetical protein
MLTNEAFKKTDEENEMKKLRFAVVLSAGLTAAFAADLTVSGVITDSMCKTNHAMMQKGPNKMSDHDCTVACVKSGQTYVLAAGGKVYQIDNQNFADLEKDAGKSVKATGQVSADGKSITLTKLSAGSAK